MKNKVRKITKTKNNHQATDEKYLLLNKEAFQQSFVTLLGHFKNDLKS